MLEPTKRSFFQRHRTVFEGFVLLFAIASALAIGSYFSITKGLENPKFCSAFCHNMRPAYESWYSSTHEGIECHKCHSEPGVAGLLKTTFITSARNVVNYISRNYGKKPIVVEIKDKNCLQEGCHKTRLLKGKVFFKRVVFDHSQHLNHLLRGRRLGCTACHSQMVVGTHIIVTESVCFICHFKRSAADLAPSGCPSCHQAPIEAVNYKGMKFVHETQLRKGDACEDCHSDITHGEGKVTEDRCSACHKGKEDVSKIHDVDFMHQRHVTEHTVKCFLCHDEVTHIISKRPMDLSCTVCHEDEGKYYAGIDIHGTPIAPSDMFSMDMDCTSCHTEEDGKVLFKPTEEVCEMCHGGEKTRTIEWVRNERNVMLSRVKALAESIASKLKDGGGGDLLPQSLYDEAMTNLGIVKSDPSEGVHNLKYTMRSLDEADKLLRAALEELE
ncbi:MAG: cytochrome c3 family protein [bacterium]